MGRAFLSGNHVGALLAEIYASYHTLKIQNVYAREIPVQQAFPFFHECSGTASREVRENSKLHERLIPTD